MPFSITRCVQIVLLVALAGGCGSDVSKDVAATSGETSEVAERWNNVGAPCDDDSDCLLGFCMRAFNDASLPLTFPEGYCTEVCDAQFGAFICPEEESFCLDTGTTDLCVARCASHEDCRAGYGCADWFGPEPFCQPVDCLGDGDCTSGQVCDQGRCFTPGSSVGAPCADASQCPEGGTCIEEFPDGYCTALRCDADSDCRGGACVDLLPNILPKLCAALCETAEDCREGYICASALSNMRIARVCAPAQCASNQDCRQGRVCQEGRCGRDDVMLGDTCVTGDDCEPDQICLRDSALSPNGFVRGYCARLGCSEGDCGEEGRCIPVNDDGEGICLRACEDKEECRTEDFYICRVLYDGLGPEMFTCLPTPCNAAFDCPNDAKCQNNVCR